MDLLGGLRDRVARLPDGIHKIGFTAVLQHIECAYRHFERGQRDKEPSLFTDAIYRCNQAFEGSAKEAFRVLAAKDPARLTPAKIEDYLSTNAVLTPRVLTLFENYRKDWRNPSTHDHTLDFNGDEALLATVSISAFTMVLINQVSDKLILEQMKEQINATQTASGASLDLETASMPETVRLVSYFVSKNIAKMDKPNYFDLAVGLHAYLSLFLDEENVSMEPTITNGEFSARPDFIVKDNDERFIVEISTFGNDTRRALADFDRVIHYLILSGLKRAVLVLFIDTGEEYKTVPIATDSQHTVYVIGPENTIDALK